MIELVLRLVQIDSQIFDRTYKHLGDSETFGEAVMMAGLGKLFSPT